MVPELLAHSQESHVGKWYLVGAQIRKSVLSGPDILIKQPKKQSFSPLLSKQQVAVIKEFSCLPGPTFQTGSLAKVTFSSSVSRS